NEKSNQMARHLQSKGIEQENVVAIMAERSMEMLIGILAIFKSGCAYLPIDPQYPAARKQYMLEDSSAAMVLTTSESYKEIAYQKEIIYIDEQLNANTRQEPEGRGEPGVRLLSGTRPPVSGLAYVIYTSGSTGNPKGAMVEHRGMTNHIWAKIMDVEINPESIVAQNASHCFDISIWQFLCALPVGGTTAVFTGELVLDPALFIRWVIAVGVTILEVVPSYLSVILNALDPVTLKFDAIDYLLVTGEEVKTNLVEAWFKAFPAIKMVNAYGPTEASDDITHHIMASAPRAAQVPIGKTLHNLAIYIVDKHMNLCPPGIKGEICVAGIGVGRGYLNNPELTAAKFIPNPYVEAITGTQYPITNNELYRTGDLGTWTQDGVVEFFGRIDFQVKIRGFRIELGDIENALVKNEQVEQSVVLAIEDSAGSYFLAAYYTGRAHEDGLRDFLSEKLPDYMIPSHFIPLQTLPLTPNGKIDRKALPKPDEITSASLEYQAPANEIEEKLVEIWQDVLELKRIGVTDNFFEIGGHSLKAINIIAKINKTFQVELPLVVLFEKPFIKDQARYIALSGTSIFTAIQAVEKKDYYPLSAGQKRMYALNRFAPDSVNYNMPGVLIIEGELSTADFEGAFQKLIQRHESLRSSFHFIESEPVQRIVDNVEFRVTYSELKGKVTEEEQEKHITGFLRSFELSRSPLLRVELLELEEKKHLFLFDTHHIVSDAVSMDLFLKEFTAFYVGRQLPSLTLQYKDYAAWQNRFLQSPELSQQKTYWLEKFSGEIPVLAMPTDYPRPAIQSFAGETVTFDIAKNITEELRSLAQKNGSTLYMILLALFNVLLSKYAGQADIIVGSPSAGRRHTDLENIIGMFVNTLAMRNYPDPGKTFSAFLTEVKQNSLEVFENQDYQFDELVERLELRRDLSRNPLFDTMFALLNVGTDDDVDIEGISFKPIPLENEITKFDINMQCVEIQEDITVHMSYCEKLFSRQTMEQFSAHFIKIAQEAIDTQGDIVLRDIKLLPVEAEQAMIRDFNTVTGRWQEQPGDLHSIGTIQDLVKKQATKTPHHRAVEYNNRHLSYEELHREAGIAAHGLRSHGIQKGTVIGVLTGDKLELVTLLLGILEAGCVFMPIDANLPLKRIQQMVKITGITVLLTDTANNNRLQTARTIDIKCERIIPARDFDKTLPTPTAVGTPAARPDDMIYIYFTSGTTGVPKAIAGKNKGLRHFIHWEIETLGITEGIRVSQFTTPGFDVLLRDVFVPLCTGGTLCIPGSSEMSDSAKLTRWVDEQKIGLIHCVPSFLRLFNIDTLNAAYFKDLRYIVMAGEQVPPGLLKSWYELFADRIQFVNLYGSTETNLAKIFYLIRPQDCADGKGRIPAGKPMKDVTAIILDSNMNICPPLIPGEIYIKTPYRSFGYYNEPRATAEKFVPNPFAGQLGEAGEKDDLVYKTGDLGRLL
ncbi:MAG: amino acid adenylation domain-containing protein, partial [bacterium]|nr:amino acid adenylation domain-containing protein [bacterium]